jgi:hypothetical protein
LIDPPTQNEIYDCAVDVESLRVVLARWQPTSGGSHRPEALGMEPPHVGCYKAMGIGPYGGSFSDPPTASEMDDFAA